MLDQLLRRSLLACVALALAGRGLAQCPEEPTLQHWTGGGTVSCPCFIPGEEWGAVFEAPAAHYPIEILRVGFGWGSPGGGQPDALEQAIKIYPNGLPNPGAAQFSLAGPVLSDGFVNEFNLSAQPGNKIINSGEFTVTIELANASVPGQPAPVHDGNGCQSGKNVVFASPGTWFNACVLGVTGDWQVHVVYRQVNCDGIGTLYCSPAMPNSTGLPGLLEVTGSDVVADDDLILTATQLPPGNIGYFIMGTGMNSFTPPGSIGPICVTPGLKRFLPPPENTDQLSGGFSRVVGTMGPVSSNITPGSTWNFQAWHRDGMDPSNLTPAISIDFQ